MSTTTIVSNSATILQESGRLVLTILSSNTAAGVLAEKTQQALDGISSAADTAMFTAGMQPDTATGIFNTVDGEYFSIPSPEADEFSILYQNVTGSAVEKKRFGTAAMSQAAIDAAAVAEAAADFAFDTVQGVADVSIYGTKAEATAAVSGLPDLALVQVLADESLSGIKSLYRKESGSLAFKQELLTKDVVDAAVVDAEAAKTAAESARDAAQLSAGVYVDTAAGLAATTSGQYFSVPVSASSDALILYKNNSGSALEITRYPSNQAVSDVIARLPLTAPNGYAWSVIDADGAAAVGVKDDGTFSAKSIESDSVVAGAIETPLSKTVDEAGDGYAVKWCDQYGNVSVGIKDDGTLEAFSAKTRDLTVETINGVNASAFGASSGAYGGSYKYEINHIISYGQSLSIGVNASPAISVSQRFDSLRFAGGVRAFDGGSDPAVIYASFQPLVESVSGVNGETPCAGFSDCVKELILAENRIAYTDQSYRLLCSAAGQGSTSVAGLSKGQVPYTKFMGDVAGAVSLAAASNQFFAVRAFLWIQGETDQNIGTTKSAYVSSLNTLIADINADVKAATGQPEDVLCLMYQTSSCSSGQTNNGVVPNAQREVANDNAKAFMACPTYFFDYIDDRHLTAQSSKWLGAYLGLAYKRVVVDGGDWSPLQPTQVWRQGKVAVVKFHVPRPPLCIDTSRVAAATNYGFSLTDSGGTPITIDSVAVIGPDTVKIVAATTIPAGAILSYATDGSTGVGRTSGPRGNLRDSQGDSIVFDGGGLNYPMHNWCVIFKEAIA